MTGLRVSEALSLRRSDLRLNQDPPVISIRPEVPGSKGREAPIPVDVLQSLADLASFHSKDRNHPMLDITRQWVGESMKRAAVNVGIEPARAHPHAFRTPTAATACFAECRSQPFSNGWGISPCRTRSAMWNWPGLTTNGLAGCKVLTRVFDHFTKAGGRTTGRVSKHTRLLTVSETAR